MKVVIFDLFGTLVPNPDPRDYDRAMQLLAEAFGLCAERFKQEWVKGFAQRMRGEIEDGHEQFIPILEALEHPYDSRQLTEATEIRRNLWLSALRPKPDALDCLNAVKARGFKLALASDCSSETPALLDLTPLGAYFEVRAISAFLRTQKPDPRMYRHILDAHGVEGADCIYVGDGNSEELPGAARLGMKTVWVDNGATQYFKERFTPGGDYRIENLIELLPILDRLQA